MKNPLNYGDDDIFDF